ncbi:hypothetical protein G7Z17_g3894 [Cylindrodendrum hubeiense]|uniref:Amidohydrolase-related domain-containing protein n=1 Tax=Cylindrodendrum hubeiense TaxID=595255 RepID=A0A9P5HFX6_9HYPO|nr:hypothetical protein G7Z17_g3894 [Cylindrodendrum hubeiense]
MAASAKATGAILLTGATVLFHTESDKVEALRNTDILVRGNKITKIGKGVSPPRGAEIVDCTGKIISPGFVDTHHHLWQTQLKGQHADISLCEYIPAGYWQSHAYRPQDMFWGQLGGAMQAIDAGTTFVLDHAHGNQTNEHANEALKATVASGLRSVFAYSHPPYFTKWDEKTCEMSHDILPKSSMEHIFSLAAQQPFGNGRVQIGFGFDYWFLPKEAIQGIFGSLRQGGVKLFTSHYAKNAVFGTHSSLIHTLQSYNLIKSPSDILLSHATGLTASEEDALRKTQIPVSSTPHTETLMGFGWPVSLNSGINLTLGVDCHTSNTSSIISMARSSLMQSRQKEATEAAKGSRMHFRPAVTVKDAFNAATISGARGVQLGDQIGSIREGKMADLVIFDAQNSPSMSCVAETDPLTAIVMHSDIRDVDAVMIDGIWRKKQGKLCAVQLDSQKNALEWSDVRKKLLASQGDILERQKKLNMEKAGQVLNQMFRIDESKLIK